MLSQIKTVEQYEIVVRSFFEDDDIVTYTRMLMLRSFTKDLCRYHKNEEFWGKFQELTGK